MIYPIIMLTSGIDQMNHVPECLLVFTDCTGSLDWLALWWHPILSEMKPTETESNMVTGVS